LRLISSHLTANRKQRTVLIIFPLNLQTYVTALMQSTEAGGGTGGPVANVKKSLKPLMCTHVFPSTRNWFWITTKTTQNKNDTFEFRRQPVIIVATTIIV